MDIALFLTKLIERKLEKTKNPARIDGRKENKGSKMTRIRRAMANRVNRLQGSLNTSFEATDGRNKSESKKKNEPQAEITMNCQ